MFDSSGENRPIRVLLVDDHQLLTGALSQMLSREPDIIVAGVAGSVAEAKAMARERLDVVLMDYRLPDGTGAEATRAIKARWPAARVVMLTALTEVLATPEICERLYIAPNTLRTHVQNIMGKLRVHSKLEAVAFALRHRLVEPPKSDDSLF